jgi:hypothetical protein
MYKREDSLPVGPKAGCDEPVGDGSPAFYWKMNQDIGTSQGK